MTAERDDARDDWLDAILDADARERSGEYLQDDGFTARVMSTLPAPAIPAWRRPAVLGMWGAAAAGAALAMPQVAIDVGREAFRLFATQPISLPHIAAGLVAIGFATWAAAAYALRSD